MTTFISIVFVLAAILSPFSMQGPSDAQAFAEGRIAFDKYKDCQAAEEAFNRVSVGFRETPGWNIYMAKTEECLGKLSNALANYQKYFSLVPNATEIINKIGDLTYQLRRNEIVGTWVAFWRDTNDKHALGRLSFLVIKPSDSGLLGNYKQIYVQDEWLNTKSGNFTIGRSANNLSISWRDAISRSDGYENKSAILIPLTSTGQVNGNTIAFQFQWSHDDWDKVNFSKIDSPEAVEIDRDSTRALDSFISQATHWMERWRNDAADRRDNAKDEDREKAADDRKAAQEDLADANALSRSINLANEYKNLFLSAR